MEQAFITGKKLSSNDVEKACARLALQLTMKGALKSLPENVHWHYKLPMQPGILEITLMLNENKLILSCKKNRTGKWINKAVCDLSTALKLGSIKP